ncbi:MAG: RNA-binding S4 domain-containing protein [Eubacterium sp.]|nr:RNA-binding S4 domain-containing protein [Eubacterium sp.]MDE6156045.1 RNA-binding S4 domain-containing protein [Eubacterium sp.]
MKIKVTAAKRQSEDVIIKTDFIRLDSFLKFKGIAETGGQAKQFIQDGIVKVNDEKCTARGKKIRNGDKISVFSIDYHIKNED